MTARSFSQAEIAHVFTLAEASAEENSISDGVRDGYVLAYVAAALGVSIPRHEAAVKAVIP